MHKLLSILIISRTASSVTRCLDAISKSTSIDTNQYEVLCSWNGDSDKENIEVPEGQNFRLIEVKPYNFAKNNNVVAKEAVGELLLFINDDVILDIKALDNALIHITNPCVGIVGANLRYTTGKLQHAGVFFDPETNKPYHRYKGAIDYNDPLVSGHKFVPCLTGAFLLMRNSEFQELLFDERFSVAGEDIVLSSAYISKFSRRLLYAANVTAVHIENETRKITGERNTPNADLELIIDVIKKRPPIKKLVLRIVTEKPGWIMYRKAEEISKNSDFLEVVINEDRPDADIHYYINYGYFNKRPASGLVIGNFTHYDKNGLADKFITSANEMDYCVAVSEATKRELIDFGVDEQKISVIRVGADRSFIPKLLVGIVGRVYKGGRKGEHLVAQLANDKEVSSIVELVATDECWDLPLLKTDSLHNFYRAIDFLLVPSLIEGGPVPFMEALASGTLSIAPNLGVVNEFSHIPYEKGDYSSLKKTIMRLAEQHVLQKTFFTNEMKNVDWEAWGFEHELLFTNLSMKI